MNYIYAAIAIEFIALVLLGIFVFGSWHRNKDKPVTIEEDELPGRYADIQYSEKPFIAKIESYN